MIPQEISQQRENIFWTLDVFLNCSSRTTHAKFVAQLPLYISDTVYILRNSLIYSTNTKWQCSHAIP